MPESSSGARGPRSFEHGFDRLAARGTQQAAELTGERVPNRIATEEEPGDADHNEQKRAEGENGVIGKRGAEPSVMVPKPVIGGSCDRRSTCRRQPRDRTTSRRQELGYGLPGIAVGGLI